MSKKANPTAIGVFTVGGLVLAAAGIILFSSLKLFSNPERFILYFDEDLTGLEVGAPVKFRGITIGSVREALIRFYQRSNDLHMPVIIELEADLLAAKSDQTVELDSQETYEGAIRKGLRAKLETENLLTGRLYVNLSFITNASLPHYHQTRPVYKEIPTVPTDISRFLRNLAKVDVSEVTRTLQSVLTSLQAKIDALGVEKLNEGMTNLLESLSSLVHSPQFTNTLASASGAFTELQSLSLELREQVGPLAKDADDTLKKTALVLEEVKSGVEELSDSLAPEAPLQREAVAVLSDLGRAARSISELAEYLKRNPSALISGKKPRELEP